MHCGRVASSVVLHVATKILFETCRVPRSQEGQKLAKFGSIFTAYIQGQKKDVAGGCTGKKIKNGTGVK